MATGVKRYTSPEDGAVDKLIVVEVEFTVGEFHEPERYLVMEVDVPCMPTYGDPLEYAAQEP